MSERAASEPAAPSEVRYELGPSLATSRARATAALATAAALAPVALVVVLLRKLGYGADPRQSTWVAAILGALAVLLIARGFASYRRSRRFLAAFRVTIADEELAVESQAGIGVELRA